MAIPAQATPDILSLLSLFTSKSGSQTQTSQSNISKEGMDALLRQILESDKGVASILSGEKKTGLYNSTVNQQLLGDFLSRSAGDLAARQAGTSTTTSTTNDPTLNPGKTAGLVLGASLLNPSISRGLKEAGIEGGIGGLGKALENLIFGAAGSNTTDYRGTELPSELRGSSNYVSPEDQVILDEEDLMSYPSLDYGGFDFLFGGTSGSGD